MIVNAILALLGLLMLVRGWKLFWLFVGVVGFSAGFQAAQYYFGFQPLWVQLSAGLACGAIGVLLAVFVQHVALAVVGFMAGGTIVLDLLPSPDFTMAGGLVILGGLVGALLLFWLFDWTLIVLSAVIGAGLAMDALGGRVPYGTLLYLTLTAVGVAIQSGAMLASRRPKA